MLVPFDEELIVGSKFAERYQILSVVGRGSMGVVYKARHELMGRLVAIKMLRGKLQLDEKSIKRFEREARAASRLDHPNVIAVHDFGLTESRQPYLVMDYSSGVTLYEIQKRERVLAPERAVHIFSQVCDALHHAHFHGVIHRDLKPSNLMIVNREDDSEFVKVFDLGVAKIAWDDEIETEAITGTGEVCGSPVYLSPEQCTHSPLDQRTDIYSLGVVMYELLTGVPPLMGETVYDTIYLHVHEPAPSFAQVTDLAIPSRLEAIVLKALAKNPEDRHQSMQELKWDLQAALVQSDPIRVLPPDARLRRKPAEAPAVKETEKDKSTSTRTRPPGPIVPPSRVTPIQAFPVRSRPTLGTKIAGALAWFTQLKNDNPVMVTAALSSVVSVMATLAVIAVFNVTQSRVAQQTLSHERRLVPEVHAPKTSARRALPAKSSHAQTPHAVPSAATAPHPARPKAKLPEVADPGRQRDPVAQIPAPIKGTPARTPVSATKLKAEPPSKKPGDVNPFFSIFAAGNNTPAAEPQQEPAPPAPVAAPPAAPKSQEPTPKASKPDAQTVLLHNEAVQLLNNEPSVAISKLKEVLRRFPNYTNAKVSLGIAYHQLANSQAQGNREQMFAAVNNYRLALDTLKEAAGPQNPKTREAQQNYDQLLERMQQTGH